MTYREFLMRVAWEELQLNNPDRTDHYLIAIAKEVHDLARRVWGKQPNSKDEQFLVKFERQKQLTEPEKRAAALAREKAKWGQRLGRK